MNPARPADPNEGGAYRPRPGQAPVQAQNFDEPLIRIDPITGDIIVANDPTIVNVNAGPGGVVRRETYAPQPPAQPYQPQPTTQPARQPLPQAPTPVAPSSGAADEAISGSGLY